MAFCFLKLTLNSDLNMLLTSALLVLMNFMACSSLRHCDLAKTKDHKVFDKKYHMVFVFETKRRKRSVTSNFILIANN